MKYCSTILLLLLVVGNLFSQEVEKEKGLNNIGVKLFGNLSLYSINYERNFPMKKHHFLAFQVGVGKNSEFILFSQRRPKSYTTVPMQVSWNFGLYPHFLEVGVGATFIDSELHPYPIIGYRLQSKKRKNGVFKITLSFPFTTFQGFKYLLRDDIDYFVIPAGISLGKNF